MDFLFKDVKNYSLLINNITLHKKSFRRGDIIFKKDDTCLNYYLILDGVIKNDCHTLYKLDTIGFEFMTTNDTFSDNYYALTNVLISYISFNDLLYLFKQDSTITLNFLNHEQKKMIYYKNKIDILTKTTPLKKVSYFLYLNHLQKKTLEFKINMTKDSLSEFLQLDYIEISKELNYLKNNNIIEFKNNIYKIKDLDILKQNI